MDPASVIAFIEFGAEVVGVIKQLLDFVGRVKNAPKSVLYWRNEVEVLGSIVAAAIKDGRDMIELVRQETWDSYRRALEAVRERCFALLVVLKDSLPQKGISRRTNLLKSFNFVFNEEKFMKLVDGLERAKNSLLVAQMCMTK